MASPDSQRRLKDAALSTSKALPNAANTVSTNIIDLGMTNPYSASEQLQVLVETGLATGANTKNINVWLQHSATNNSSNMADIAGFGLQTIAGNATKYPISTLKWPFPVAALRYLRAQCLGEANGGDASDANITVSVVK